MSPRRRQSAGILLWRRASTSPDGIEVLLAHPGGPLFAKRDEDTWTVPKGEYEGDGTPYDEARREFEEETGFVPPDGEAIDLGEIQQKGGKYVVCWALEGDLDPAAARSNSFLLEWPPRSGKRIEVPEIDRVAWFTPADARWRVKAAQSPFIDRLLDALAGGSP